MSRPTGIVVAASAACAGLLGLTGGLPAAPADNGKLAFNNLCRTCHSLKEDDNRLGPSLHRIFGAKAGQSSGYAYSQSLRQSGVTWNEATLDRWIENPESVIPNNNMKPYNGLADAAVRKSIVNYLKMSSEGS
jgi:cytochrome c